MSRYSGQKNRAIKQGNILWMRREGSTISKRLLFLVIIKNIIIRVGHEVEQEVLVGMLSF